MSRRKLELTWPHKDKVLLRLDEHGEPVWGTWDGVDTRLLIKQAHYGDPDAENILIRGDNLLALQALLPQFAGKIKLIYIDPPFNTGAAYEYYDDGLEHTIWLSLMKSRLELLWKLLADEGIIFVHIDEIELAYLRVVMDEIFHNRNLISIICWQRTPEITFLGQGQSYINTIMEYLLVYAKDISRCQLNRVSKRLLATSRVMQQYNLFVTLGERELSSQGTSASGIPYTIYRYTDFDVQRIPANISKLEYIKRFDTIYRYARVNPDNTFLSSFVDTLNPEELFGVVYTPTRGKSAGRDIECLFHRRNQLWPAANNAFVEGGEIYRKADMSNLWTNDEISATRIANEGGVRFRRGKKPEELLQRVIEIGSRSGDIVLDSFAGSGTTGAVAHKMERKWIMVEIGDHAETHIIPRMQRVISGEDQSGISKAVGWKGGGGFAYYTLGESVVGKDTEIGVWVLNYTNSRLIEAICLREGFTVIADGDLHGKKGNHYAHVAQDFVTQEYVNHLLSQLGDDERLTIYCESYDPHLRGSDRAEIKRIPQALMEGS